MKKYNISSYVLGFVSPFLLGDFEDTDEACFKEDSDGYFSDKNVFQGAEDIFSKIETYQTKNWMERHKYILNKKPLCQIILPGAHDAGAYGFDRKSKVVDLPKFIEKVRKVVQKLPGDGYLTRWSKTQKLTIAEQLEAGIRYFDLRVSQDKNKNFYLYHGLQGPNLEPVLQAFHDFLRNNKGEILILDMSHFFKVSHAELLKLIDKYLVEFCATKNDIDASVTYEELIRKNKRCLLYYDEKNFSNNAKFLLGKSNSYWANKQDIQGLKNALKDYHGNHSHSSPWVFQYVLTPNAKYIVKHPLGSVEDLAKITHEHMGDVLNDCKQSFPINIVMFDFVNEILCRKIIDLNF